MRPRDISALLDALITADVAADERKDTVMLVGKPGAGKTSLPIQAAKRNNLFLVFFHPLFSEPIDLTGVPHIILNKTHWAAPSWVPESIPAGCKGIMCLVDEMSQADVPMQKACAPICEEHRFGTQILPHGSIVVATGNRAGDRSGANKLLKHVQSRIIQVPFEDSLEDFESWGMETGKIIPQVRYFLRFKPDCLNTFKPEAEDQYATQRGWHKVSRLYPILPKHLLNETLAGVIGKGEAAEFLGFCKVWEEMTNSYDVKKILSQPEKAKIPPASSPDIAWAVTGSVAEAARNEDIKVMESALVYFQRMPREFGFIGVHHLTDRQSKEKQEKLFRNKNYLAWYKDNLELMRESKNL